MKLLDTCFLIHLQREWIRGEPGPAREYLERPSEDEYAVSVVTTLEFLEGYRHPRDAERFLEPFRQIDVNSEIARVGSRIRRDLRERVLDAGLGTQHRPGTREASSFAP